MIHEQQSLAKFCVFKFSFKEFSLENYIIIDNDEILIRKTNYFKQPILRKSSKHILMMLDLDETLIHGI